MRLVSLSVMLLLGVRYVIHKRPYPHARLLQVQALIALDACCQVQAHNSLIRP